jgi:hypothetical protein
MNRGFYAGQRASYGFRRASQSAFFMAPNMSMSTNM